jgi:hypothetical protein
MDFPVRLGAEEGKFDRAVGNENEQEFQVESTPFHLMLRTRRRERDFLLVYQSEIVCLRSRRLKVCQPIGDCAGCSMPRYVRKHFFRVINSLVELLGARSAA